MYGMQKTTIYLPAKLKRALKRAAAQLGQSEAQLIRAAVERSLTEAEPPRPRLPLFRGTEPRLAENLDAAMRGFGER